MSNSNNNTTHRLLARTDRYYDQQKKQWKYNYESLGILVQGQTANGPYMSMLMSKTFSPAGLWLAQQQLQIQENADPNAYSRDLDKMKMVDVGIFKIDENYQRQRSAPNQAQPVPAGDADDWGTMDDPMF